MEKVIILIFKVYRYALSPWFGQSCRFYPSCSQYSETAMKEWGLWKGIGYSMRRLLKCHPWHRGGFDPCPMIHQLKDVKKP